VIRNANAFIYLKQSQNIEAQRDKKCQCICLFKTKSEYRSTTW